ncbi:sugar ABC transporter permease, partial [bacterium]|nr:sugar ABC transporter permease [bacterium]
MRQAGSETRLTLALLIPSLIGVAVFVYGFIAWTGYISLTDWRGLLPDYALKGFGQYKQLFNHPRFRQDLVNTGVFTLMFLAGNLFLGLTLATLLDRRLRGAGFFRSLFMFPMAVSF